MISGGKGGANIETESIETCLRTKSRTMKGTLLLFGILTRSGLNGFIYHVGITHFLPTFNSSVIEEDLPRGIHCIPINELGDVLAIASQYDKTCFATPRLDRGSCEKESMR